METDPRDTYDRLDGILYNQPARAQQTRSRHLRQWIQQNRTNAAFFQNSPLILCEIGFPYFEQVLQLLIQHALAGVVMRVVARKFERLEPMIGSDMSTNSALRILKMLKDNNIHKTCNDRVFHGQRLVSNEIAYGCQDMSVLEYMVSPRGLGLDVSTPSLEGWRTPLELICYKIWEGGPRKNIMISALDTILNNDVDVDNSRALVYLVSTGLSGHVARMLTRSKHPKRLILDAVREFPRVRRIHGGRIHEDVLQKLRQLEKFASLQRQHVIRQSSAVDPQTRSRLHSEQGALIHKLREDVSWTDWVREIFGSKKVQERKARADVLQGLRSMKQDTRRSLYQLLGVYDAQTHRNMVAQNKQKS